MLSSMPSEPRKATDSDLLKAIGDAIMRARESHPDDLSQQDVADRAGIDRVQYNRYELGKVMPGWDKILKIAAVLEVDPGALIPGQIMSFQPCSGKTTSLIISRLPLFMQQPGRLNRRVSSDEARSIAAVAKAPQTKERAIDGARAAKGDGLTLEDRFDQLLEMVIAINDDLAEAGIATTRADRASRALARQPRRNQ